VDDILSFAASQSGSASLAAADAASPLFRNLAHVIVRVELQRSRVMHGRMYNNSFAESSAKLQRWVPLDRYAVVADVQAANDAFRAEQLPALEGTCARLLAARASIRVQGATSNAAHPAPSLFPSPVSGRSLLQLMEAYKAGAFLSWSIGIPAGEYQRDFEAAWDAVAGTAADVGITASDLLVGLASRNALDELQGLAARHAGIGALVALCRDTDGIQDGALADRIFTDGGWPQTAALPSSSLSPLAGVAAELASYLTHYGHMADNDEDLNSTHWVEDSAFPLSIFRKIVLSRAAPQACSSSEASASAAMGIAAAVAAVPPALPAHRARTHARTHPYARTHARAQVVRAAVCVSTAGMQVSEDNCLTRGASTSPPAAPAMLRRASSTAPTDSYEAARELLDGLLRGPDGAGAKGAAAADALWAATDLLRRCLLLKERIHGQYVRIGLQVKLMLQQWIRERRPRLDAAWASIGGGDAQLGAEGAASDEMPAALFHAPFPYWVRALVAEEEEAAVGSGCSGGGGETSPSLAASAPLPALMPSYVQLVHAARRFSRERAMWRRVDATVSVRGTAAWAAQQALTGDADASLDCGACESDGAREETRAERQAQQVLHGFGCSVGAAGAPVTGLARIVPSLDQAHRVQAGEVLVTRVTSPAWTPLFSLVRAIVLEEGGMLAHGAVVARECGIPAVSQVREASRVIRTGDTLVVDGAAGTVTVIPPAAGTAIA
jgi:phosphohistidine swiveling domain-containing protein